MHKHKHGLEFVAFTLGWYMQTLYVGTHIRAHIILLTWTPGYRQGDQWVEAVSKHSWPASGDWILEAVHMTRAIAVVSVDYHSL